VSNGAYIELLSPDRPIHMVGQPIIKLVAEGGPGGDLGDISRSGSDMPGHSAFLNMADIQSARSLPALGGLGCCGSGMDDASPVVEAKALDARCKDIEKRIEEIVRIVADNVSFLPPGQQFKLMTEARRHIDAFKADYRACLLRLRQIVKSNRKTMEDAGLGKLEGKTDDKLTLESCRDRLKQIRALTRSKAAKAAKTEK